MPYSAKALRLPWGSAAYRTHKKKNLCPLTEKVQLPVPNSVAISTDCVHGL